MSGNLLHAGAVVTCSHGGSAIPTATNARVTVSGKPTVLLSTHYAIANCPHRAPPRIPSPCLMGTWLTGSTRVFSHGQRLALQSGKSTCVPNGTPLLPAETQARVVAA